MTRRTTFAASEIAKEKNSTEAVFVPIERQIIMVRPKTEEAT